MTREERNAEALERCYDRLCDVAGGPFELDRDTRDGIKLHLDLYLVLTCASPSPSPPLDPLPR